MEITKPINEQITESELLVIDDKGIKIGVLKLEDALKKAKTKKLDLILINKPANQLAVAKIDNYKRFLYKEKIKNKNTKKGVSSNRVKEIKVKPQISDYDIKWLTDKMIGWINKGHQVKLKIKAMGRVGFKEDLIKETYEKFVAGLKNTAKVQVPLKKLSPVLHQAIFVKGK